MIDEFFVIGYAIFTALGVFAVVFALLRLRAENRELRARLEKFEREREGRAASDSPLSAAAGEPRKEGASGRGNE